MWSANVPLPGVNVGSAAGMRYVIVQLLAEKIGIISDICPMSQTERGIRHLVLILGDHLDPDSLALEGFDTEQDMCWMAEVPEESTIVWSHKARITLFLSAMRHHAAGLRRRGFPLEYLTLANHPYQSLSQALEDALLRWQPQQIISLRPGTWQLQESIRHCAESLQVPWEQRRNHNFLFSVSEFGRWAENRRQMRLEFWYRHARQKTGILMKENQPVAGRWNFDPENRQRPGPQGPGWIPEPLGFPPDAITQEVMALVETQFAGHPGSLQSFDWPVTPQQAQAALQDFLDDRLAQFGPLQDAFWPGQVWLYHSRLSAAMNLGLIRATTVIQAVEENFRTGKVSIASAEGFIRQILGWREYIHGLYWLNMPQWLQQNILQAHQPLPDFYWTAETDMSCLQDSIARTLKHGYAHHIERLMITGLFAQLLGVEPKAIHHWFLAIYVDAVEWVELPNVIGMSQYADGGWMASKPYVASGNYLQKMGGHCQGCRYQPRSATGTDACPFTVLYWDFLQTHQTRFSQHPRTALQWKHLERMSAEHLRAIRTQARVIRQNLQHGKAFDLNKMHPESEISRNLE